MDSEDKVVKSFDLNRFSKLTRIPLICVYRSPSDYPGKYIARLWDVDRPTNVIAIAESLEEIREAKPAEMAILQRYPSDDPVIVETWI
jgi:endonuclease V-like protein UPF0215 family